MRKKIDILVIQEGENEEWDFGVSTVIRSFSQKEMDEFRQMMMEAIGIAEDMYRRQNQKVPLSLAEKRHQEALLHQHQVGQTGIVV